MKRQLQRILVIVAMMLPVCAATSKPSRLVLKRQWVASLADRATVTGEILVDDSLTRPKKPNKSQPSNDGDIHAAGRSKEVGLPMVAEIMNAQDRLNAVSRVNDFKKNKTAATFTGVWRLWFEHPPSGQTQVQDLEDLGSGAPGTNPAHCFEIHPLTEFDNIPLEQTFHSVPGYNPKDAKTAFGRYEKLKISLKADSQTVTLSSSMIGFNYVRFKIQLQDKASDLKDSSGDITGKQAKVDVFEVDSADDSDPLATDVRTIFVKGTKPEQEVASLQGGDELVVWGVPRLNLNAVETFLEAGGTQATNRKLTYEMVIVAVEEEE
jgi:hypothetical protein